MGAQKSVQRGTIFIETQKSLLKSTKLLVTHCVVATSECGYAFRLAFCHSADKKRYAQKVSGYVSATVVSYIKKNARRFLVT